MQDFSGLDYGHIGLFLIILFQFVLLALNNKWLRDGIPPAYYSLLISGGRQIIASEPVKELVEKTPTPLDNQLREEVEKALTAEEATIRVREVEVTK